MEERKCNQYRPRSAKGVKEPNWDTVEDCIEYINAFFTHLAVDLVERPPALLLTFTMAD
jgi:hypothetical protein